VEEYLLMVTHTTPVILWQEDWKMKIEDTVNWDISVCGLNCAKCDIYEACHGNKKLRGEILEWFGKNAMRL